MPIMKSGLVITALILIVGSVACVPIPHRYQHDPNVEGVVEFSNASLSPSSVGFFRCAPSIHECEADIKLDTAKIESPGTFRLVGTRKFAAYAVPMAHCNLQWSVEFYDAESNVLGSHTFGRYGACVAPEVIQLACAISPEGSLNCDSSGI